MRRASTPRPDGKVILSVKVDPFVKNGLARLAAEDDRSLGHYVARLLREHCDGMLPLEEVD